MLNPQEFCQTMEQRCSRRTYSKTATPALTQALVAQCAQEVREQSGLPFPFVAEGSKALAGTASHGMFTGAPSYVALVGPDTQKGREDCGYYGELLLLTLVFHGLGTCWVAGTYQKAKVSAQVPVGTGDALFGILAVGECPEEKTTREKMIYTTIHKTKTTYQQMLTSGEKDLPPLLKEALLSLEQTPSALNRHACRFRYDNGVLSAQVEKPLSVNSLDLGIAKFHLQKTLEAKGVCAHWDAGNALSFDSK